MRRAIISSLAWYYYNDRYGLNHLGTLPKQSFRYEIPATSISVVNGTSVEVFWNDVQNGKYAEETYYVTDQGAGLSGRVINGKLHPGDTVRLLTRDPETGASVEREVKVKRLEMFHKLVDEAIKGDYVGMIFEGLENGVLQRGCAIVGTDSALHNLGSSARLTGVVELNDQRANPFKNGDSIQLYFNGIDMTASFIQVNGDPIAANTTREGVVMGELGGKYCLYPGLVLKLREGGREFGTFTITNIQN